MTGINNIEYDSGRERLTITFATGRIYEYVDVPGEVAASFQSAFAKDAFFNTYSGIGTISGNSCLPVN